MESIFKRIRLILPVFCVALTIPFSTAGATIAKPAASNPSIDKLKGDIEYVSQQEATEVKKYLDLKAESQKASANLAAFDKKIKAAETRKAAAQQEAANAKAEYAAAQERYDKAVKASQDAHERSKKAAVRLYQEYSNPDAVPSIYEITVDDRQEIVRKSILVEKYNRDQLNVIATADKKASIAEEEKKSHEDARIRAEEAERIAADEEALLAPLRAEFADAQKKAKASEVAEQAIVNSIRAKKAEYTKQMAKMQAESNALAAQIKKQQSSSTPAVPGRMIKPVSAAIVSPFGYRIHPIYGDSRLHAGADFGASYGTAIKAAKAGKVIYASQMSGYGNVIIIDHGGGVSSLYAHQSSFAVGLGAQLTQGQTIGYVGATGNVTGPHLHFEVRVNGAPVDPMGYF